MQVSQLVLSKSSGRVLAIQILQMAWNANTVIGTIMISILNITQSGQETDSRLVKNSALAYGPELHTVQSK